jgi:hypothetical protein
MRVADFNRSEIGIDTSLNDGLSRLTPGNGVSGNFDFELATNPTFREFLERWLYLRHASALRNGSPTLLLGDECNVSFCDNHTHRLQTIPSADDEISVSASAISHQPRNYVFMKLASGRGYASCRIIRTATFVYTN